MHALGPNLQAQEFGRTWDRRMTMEGEIKKDGGQSKNQGRGEGERLTSASASACLSLACLASSCRLSSLGANLASSSFSLADSLALASTAAKRPPALSAASLSSATSSIRTLDSPRSREFSRSASSWKCQRPCQGKGKKETPFVPSGPATFASTAIFR